MSPPAHLRLALTALSPRERQVMVTNVRQAAEKWRDLLPRVSAVWSAMADELAEVEQMDQARRASGITEQTIRPVQRGPERMERP
jgi:hypothetical protein